MVTYHPSDAIPMSDFEFAWRITDAQWTALPDRVLSRIKPLSPSKSREVFEKSPGGSLSDQMFDPTEYQAVRHVSLEEETGSECARTRQSFRELPVASNQEIYLCWQVGEGVAAVTNWGTFIEIWDDLWYPFDRMWIFDESRAWALLLGPEERAVFIERKHAAE